MVASRPSRVRPSGRSGRIYAAWALSQDFYRAGLHLASGPQPNLGAPGLGETFLRTDWEDRFRRVRHQSVCAASHWDAGTSVTTRCMGDLPRALR